MSMGNTVGSPSDPVTTDPRQRRGEMMIPVYDTSTSSHAGISQLSNEELGAYISGYIDVSSRRKYSLEKIAILLK